jgi:ATP phosphoribosyltransferase regulatory subunit
MYTYSGPVFRLQPSGENRPVEYLQAGIERFGDPDQAATDAEVFLSLREGVELLGIDRIAATLGDLSIVIAVLDALEIPDRRREALKRHLWRPARFQDLLDRACNPVVSSDARQHVLSLGSSTRHQFAEQAGEVVGSRDISEVLERLQDLDARQSEPAMDSGDARLIADVFKVSGPVAGITEQIRQLTGPAGIDIETTLERFDARLRHLLDAGCRAEELHFDAAFGRSLEYYDGFVFEIRKAGTDRYPPLAGGGRYNAMTTRLGAMQAVPAVGGIVRPEAVLDCLL